MLKSFLREIKQDNGNKSINKEDYVFRSNMSVIRIVAVVVILVSLYWTIIDFVSDSYNLNFYAKLGVYAQLLASVYMFFVPNLYRKLKVKLAKYSFLVYYLIIILGIATINYSRNVNILAAGDASNNIGVSVSAFYLFMICFMPLYGWAESIIVIVAMYAGLLIPEFTATVSSYSIFAILVLCGCFTSSYLFFRRRLFISADREIEIISLNEKLTRLAYCDALTGTLNRRSLDIYLEHLESNSRTKQIAVAVFDIDLFKRYNDFYGHVIGDETLVRIAEASDEAVKGIPSAYVFRYGGGKFIAIRDNADEQSLFEMMNRIRECVTNRAIKRDDNTGFDIVTVTIGGSLETVSKDAGDYILNADNQLYYGKKSLRDGIYYKGQNIVSDSREQNIEKTADVNKMNEYGRPTVEYLCETICEEIEDIYCVNVHSRRIETYRHRGIAAGMDEYIYGGMYDDARMSYIKNSVHPVDRQMMTRKTDFDSIISQLKKQESVNIYFKAIQNGEIAYYQLRCIRLGSADNFNEIVLAFLPEDVDVGQMQNLHAIETDELTSIYTKQAFLHRARTIIDDNPTVDYTMVVSDVDNFKFINSVYGENDGNNLLKYLADSFSAVEGCELIGRYGGDQFAMLFKSSAYDTAEDFVESTESIKQNAALPYIVIKYGIYSKVDRADSISMMCDKALLALKTIKHVSDKVVSNYDDEVVELENKHRIYEASFEKAIENKEFVVYYQPKYDSQSKTLTGAEALVRWKTSDGKMIPPSEFIPVFESRGLIPALDEYVFRTVCEKQRQIIDSGLWAVPVSVNVSRATLFSQGVVSRYDAMANEFGLDKKYVPVEITESSAVDSAKIKDFATQIKEAGFKLHMDDFGTGYSSLSTLSMLPFDVVKLDKSLIDDIGKVSGEEIIKHTVELAHYLRMEVVAEGVENNDQLNFLQKLGCDTIQGYLLGRPIPYDEYYDIVSTNIGLEVGKPEADIGSLRLTNELKVQYLQALSTVYMTMHVIDLEDDSVIEFSTTTNVREQVNRAHGAVPQMIGAMKATVAPDYIEAALKFTDLTTIRERMRGKRTIEEEFNGIHFGWFKAQFITITANEDDEPVKLIFTTQVVQSSGRSGVTFVDQCRNDELTGVLNRDAYNDDVVKYDSSETDELGKENLTVIAVDINGLRLSNEKFGHSAGDEMINGVAEILNDVVSEYGSIYRIGGDDFTAIIHANEKELEFIKVKLDVRIANWMGNNIRRLDLSYSIVCSREFPDLSLEALTREADKKLFKIKTER